MVIARRSAGARSDPEYSLETVLARARAEDDTPVEPLWPGVISLLGHAPHAGWLTAAVTMAAVVVLSLGLFSLWNVRPLRDIGPPAALWQLHFETRHANS